MLGQEPTMIDPYTGEEISVLQTDPYTGRIIDMQTGQIVYDPTGQNTGLWLDNTGEVTSVPPSGPLVIEITGGTIQQSPEEQIVIDPDTGVIVAPGETGSFQPADSSLIERLRIASGEFWTSLYALEALRSTAYAVGMATEYEEQVASSRAIVPQLDAIATAVQDAWGWTKSTFGLAGLGVAPMVIYAVSATAVLLMIGYLVDHKLTNDDLAQRIKAREKGIPVPLPGPPTPLPQAITNTVMWIALGAVAIVIVPKLLEKKS